MKDVRNDFEGQNNYLRSSSVGFSLSSSKEIITVSLMVLAGMLHSQLKSMVNALLMGKSLSGLTSMVEFWFLAKRMPGQIPDSCGMDINFRNHRHNQKI